MRASGEGGRRTPQHGLTRAIAAGRHRNGADILADVIYEGTMGMDEGAPTTARLRDVLNRAECVVIAEGSPDEAEYI
ncbi:hypothetical protein GCM10017674_80490 [Streptomyces gardneri]|uniref:Uncharacterized protein n=1 Tax=Streptomyces gardneri TaxID=66892 RepID=A0A4Y3RX67_9ACTN|nr:hypothetical protein SGA01_77570 [Streptomyces gardneri]GHH23682.1 hypothetical protein GCM10017674_80490 [Streptomyces gardneri]